MKLNVYCIIMGGGRGDRLYPLTKTRCKPAVPLAGKYRLVDIPISNCLNSSFNKIYILTQFQTRSLHRHIEHTYRFDNFSDGIIDIFSAEQTSSSGEHWYVGNADAVRKNLQYIAMNDEDIILILSGDQLYRMDLSDLIQHHVSLKADATISAKPIPEYKIPSFGIMALDENFSINNFVEKPQDKSQAEGFEIPFSLRHLFKNKGFSNMYLASMGIYVFTARVLKEVLTLDNGSDFGKNIIPNMVHKYEMCGYIFDGFWEDIGTVRSFFDTNLMLTDVVPEFDFFDAKNPIYTCARYLPACKVNSSRIENTLLSDGCIITEAALNRCVVGLRSVIRKNAYLENVLMFGADYFDPSDIAPNEIGLGVGENSVIKRTILDKNVRIGKNVYLSPDGKPDGYESDGLCIKDGILCVTNETVIKDNTIF
ncbi:MAG: glucose-1-phosphate adenylyltransferase [Puniceicoccales bacterium]|nr:glucose-1-phosphate adenylyltransferase [Puniceicoccales bacterium]